MYQMFTLMNVFVCSYKQQDEDEKPRVGDQTKSQLPCPTDQEIVGSGKMFPDRPPDDDMGLKPLESISVNAAFSSSSAVGSDIRVSTLPNRHRNAVLANMAYILIHRQTH